MYYKYETHIHSCQGSACAIDSAAEMALACLNQGYAGMVLTDHFVHGNTAVPRHMVWDCRMQLYYDAYLSARAAVEGMDFTVLFGLEHSFGNGLEVLTYGIDLDFLLHNPDLPLLTPAAYGQRVREAGGLVIQAHPYRDRSYISKPGPLSPRDLDGVEVHNMGNRPEENRRARQFAQAYPDLIPLAGSDAHAAGEAGRAGVAFPYPVRDAAQFVQALRRRDGLLIVDGEIEGGETM